MGTKEGCLHEEYCERLLATDCSLILWFMNHILHALLHDRRPKLCYELTPRSHNRELAPKLLSA